MKPSEPFLTPYLKGPPMNLTEEQLDNQIYPVWTYSYLVTLFVVFLVTDVLRYKPVIITEGLAYLTTRILLIWASGVLAMQFMQFAYGVATGAEVAYYSYIYAVVDKDRYQIVTSYTRAAVLLGRMLSGVIGQLLISLKVTDYLTLNYISLGSVSISCIVTLLLPKASGNVFGTRMEECEPIVQQQHNGFFSSWKRTMFAMFHDFKLCYSDKQLLRWSLWWAFATCGEFQVENYVQNLWDIIYPSHKHKIYNGGVTAISHLTGSLVAIALAYVKINWSLFGELCLGVVSVADAFFLFLSAQTSSIWMAYLMYILFRTAYTFLITVASLQIAKHVEMTRFALVFGINMFAALLLQTILTSIVVDERGLNLPVKTQFVIYGSYFFIIGAVFLARAVFHMTRVGWQRCWQQRYRIENQPLTVMADINEGEANEPVGLNTDVLTDEQVDNKQ
ncbi:hypothetical protein ACROYT_G028579 [Oculina patagonica]